ncbi:MAG: hypothetical protein SFV23_24100 [Planctomycetaceae bacterium]|nr:hypothetical protein [Planctomycetaceae bacterium]
MPPWLQTFFEILMGGPTASTGEVLLRGALIGCSLFAGVQLLTMLVTRWGDHNAMSKSFVLSMLVHVCLGLGWATAVAPAPLGDELLPGEPEPVPIQQVLVEGTESIATGEAGNTAFWQQPTGVPQVEPLRASRASRSLLTDASTEVLPNPAREPVTTAALPLMDLPQIPTQSEESAQFPETPLPAQVASVSSAAPATGLPEATAASRAELGSVGGSMVRQTLNRPPIAESPLVPQPPSTSAPGSAQRMAATPDDLALSAPLPLDQNPTLPRAVGAEGDAIVRKASPAAMPRDAADTGGGPAATASSASAGGRFTRAASGGGGRGGLSDAEPSLQVARVETARPNFDANRERLGVAGRPSLTDADAPQLPEIVRSKPTTTAVGSRAQAATTYRLRRLERRREIALRNGGTAESEAAVENALAYLSRMQEPEGFWDADRHGGGVKEVRQIDPGKPPGGTQTDTGVTGLAILAYLGAGYTHDEGEYEQTVKRAIDWLVAQQRSDGYLGGNAAYYDQMYCHGIAVYALAEAYGMQQDPTQFPALREAVGRGVWYIAETQNSDGGWRYRVGASLSDMSMFGWQLMALKSAELAGIAIPSQTRTGLIKFLKDRSRGAAGGLAGYKQETAPTPAMTAEALFCKQMYGLRRGSPASEEAARYLQANLPELSYPDEYYWYYGTLAMFQYGGEPWDAWNGAMRETLLRLQRQSGANAGSWDPAGPWGTVGGRIYSTALSTMCLEVYYRFLPLYQVGAPE